MTDLVTEFSTLKGLLLSDKNIPQHLLTDFVGSRKGQAHLYFRPDDEDSLQQAVKLAYAHRLPVTVRGAGTNLVGATVPQGGLLLDVSALNKILNLDESNMCITVQPGVVLKDLIAFVESRGYFYPPDPAEKNATIGGNVATNAGGMRAVKYGVTRDYVLSLELIRVDGTKVVLGAKTRKDTTGLSLKNLVIGSEGTLGIISRIVLKLLPLPAFSQSAVIAYHSLSDGIASVNHILNARLYPTAIEFVERRCIALGERFLHKEFPCPDADSFLIVTFDGDKSQVKEKLQVLSGVVLSHGAYEVVQLDDPVVAANVWSVRSALAQAVKASGVWEPVDTVVPLAKIAEFVKSCRRISEDLQIRIVPFGHAGDGNVHLCVLKDNLSDDKWPELLDRTLDALYDSAYSLGGLISAEHGIGKAKRKYFLKHVDPAVRELMLGVKHSFDPNNLLNPHDGYSL